MLMRTGMRLPLSLLSSQRCLQQPRLVNNPGQSKENKIEQAVLYFEGGNAGFYFIECAHKLVIFTFIQVEKASLIKQLKK